MPRQLLAGEMLVLPLHRHWIVLVKGLATPSLVAAALLLLMDGALRDLVPGEVRLLGTLLALVTLGMWVIVTWLRWGEDALTVTDQRVILEEGMLRRSSRVIPLDRVQDVSTSQTPLGRLLGYGAVSIEAAGLGSTERFDYVGSPEDVRDRVFVLAGRVRQGG